MTTHAELVAQEELEALEAEKYQPATPEEIELVEQYRQLNKQAKAIENQKKAISAKLKTIYLLKGIRGIVNEGIVISDVIEYETTTTDTKGLIKDYPEIAAQYVSTKTVSRFNVK